MRTLSATLTTAQKAMGDAICKIVLTQQGDSTIYAYALDTTNRILNLSHSEEEWSQVCQALIDNREGNLTTLALEGYSGVISNGYHTGVTRSAWVASTEYAVGTYIIPTTANGYQYKCTTTGTSGTAGNEPTWGTSLGGTTDDAGDLVWTLDGNDGDEYSPAAPLEVIAQKTDSMQGELATTISLAGVFNMMGEDEASVAYVPDEINTDTVKTILTAIANKTMSCFSHCKSYTITFDSEDSLIDSYQPKDYFNVGFKESRLSAFKKALSYTKCKARIEDDGEIHVFVPTISGDTWTASTAYVLNDYVQPSAPNYNFTYRCTIAGTSASSPEPTWKLVAGETNSDGGVTWTCVAFDYEYNDAYGDYHNFFDKSVRKRLVIPNKVTVLNHPDHTDTYSGTATDADSYAALNRYMTEYHYTRPTSNAQCVLIATAVLQNYQLAAEKGHGVASMNVGQEVMDYVKITDSRASDFRIGNIGFINRWYSAYPKQPTRFGFEFRFGSLLLPGLAGTMPPRQITVVTSTQLADQWSPAALRADINNLYDYLNQVISNQALIIDFMNTLPARMAAMMYEHLTIKSLNVTERFQGPMGADKYDKEI